MNCKYSFQDEKWGKQASGINPAQTDLMSSRTLGHRLRRRPLSAHCGQEKNEDEKK